MFLEDEQEEIREDEVEPGLEEPIAEEDEEGYLEEEETLEELDVDDRGHVRPRKRSRFDEYNDEPEY